MKGARVSLADRLGETDAKFYELMKEFNELMGPAHQELQEREALRLYQHRQTRGSQSRGGRLGSSGTHTDSGLTSLESTPSVSPARRCITPSCSSTTPSTERPTSASSFRELVSSARREVDLSIHRERQESASVQETHLKASLHEEQFARQAEQQRRAAERAERQRKRQERCWSEAPASSTAASVPSGTLLASPREEPSHLPSVSESPPGALPPSQTTPPTQVDEVDEEERRVLREAQQRLEARRQRERAEAEEVARAEESKLKLWEHQRELAWNERLTRTSLTEDESRDRQVIMRQMQLTRFDLLELVGAERRQREGIVRLQDVEAWELDSVRLRATEQLNRRSITTASNRNHQALLGQHRRERMELLHRAEEIAAREPIIADEGQRWADIRRMHSERITVLVERQLWRVNVDEVEVRLNLEREEKRVFDTLTEGTHSSRERVRLHKDQVDTARAAWRSHYLAAAASIAEDEAAKRILLLRDESQEFDRNIAGPSRAGWRAAREASEQRHKLSVEQAIRAAQLWQAQHSTDVVYQPVAATRPLKKRSQPPKALLAAAPLGPAAKKPLRG